MKVLLAKKKIDVHGRATKVIARELRDAGMEVVYFRFGVVAEIVEAAVQEDVDVVAVSIMTSGQLQIAQELVPLLREAGLGDRLLIMGGVIPEVDFEPLMSLGVDRVFLPGIPGSDVADYIRAALATSRSAGSAT